MIPSAVVRLLFLFALLFSLAVGPAPAALAAPPSADASVETVRQGFDLLMDRFVHPLSSDTLLGAAWDGAAAAAGVESAPRPLFVGDRATDWQRFAEAFETLARHSGVDRATLAAAALPAMADAASEGHTYYLSPQRYQDYLAWLRGEVQYTGIGIRLDAASLVILEVFEGSPADQAGLLAGDAIVAVDGQSTAGGDRVQTIDRIRGPIGTTVTLTVARAGVEQPLVVSIVRSLVQVAFVNSELLPGGVGYLRLRGFADMGVASDFEEALDQLRQQGATSLVVDLRGNSGGRLDVGSRLLSLFVPSGPLYRHLDRSSHAVTALAQGGYREPPLPLAVLVDAGTASMGEIFAAAIQDHHRGAVVGTRTAGSVAAAQVFPLADGSALQITVMEITSALGRPLNTIGVTPDRLAEPNLEALRNGRDVQLEAAVAALQQQPVGASVWPGFRGARLERLAA